MSQEWKLVPVEPTTEQRLAVCMHPDLASALYRSMIKAAPVPPAVGEPEVLAWRAHGFNFSTEAMAHDYNKWAEEKQPVQYLVDRSHLARLQAENAAHQQRLNVADQRNDELKSELTKAREWMRQFRDVAYGGFLDDCHLLRTQRGLDEALAHQSAPAASFIACKVDESCGRDGGDE